MLLGSRPKTSLLLLLLTAAPACSQDVILGTRSEEADDDSVDVPGDDGWTPGDDIGDGDVSDEGGGPEFEERDAGDVPDDAGPQDDANSATDLARARPK